MNRQEAIQRIIWSLLAHANAPHEAVAAALTVKPHLGRRAEADFRNLLRAAGLFAWDEDGFFVRYVRPISAQEGNGLPSLPSPTHLLTVPVPVEPRMRIAYSVFTGLLLKHLYQCHAAVPLQVTEGMALLWAPEQPTAPAVALPAVAEQIWQKFQDSELAECALQDGIEATFLGLRGGRPIGAVEVPQSWKGTRIEALLREAVDRNPRAFQAQSRKDKIQFAGESRDTIAATPLSVAAIDGAREAQSTGVAVASGRRCLVCGSEGDMIQGGKFFLPENKKQWYEEPGPRDKFPKLCAACAYVALLSGITPSSNQSIVEFPADNFLELFALYEHLQGVSGAVALKTLNRVATLSILPSRYLLLSKNSRQGRMDSKTQIYVQLRHHTPLLQNLDRPMRVQIEGSQPNFWSEIYPHVAIGLSHFARMPSYYETKDRKVLAQRATRALTEGRPFGALYLATEAERERREAKGPIAERAVLNRGLRAFENEFVRTRQYGDRLAHALGGERMSCDFFGDVIDFSNYLLTLCQPLVKREVRASRSSVSGIARKFTDLIAGDFGQCHAAKFLYVTCQRADQAEKGDAWWAKRDVFAALYPTAKGDAHIKKAQQQLDAVNATCEEVERALKQAGDAEREAKAEALKQAGEQLNEALSAVREAWDAFRTKTPWTELESRLGALHQRYGGDAVIWRKFLREVEARTLALLLLNVHRTY